MVGIRLSSNAMICGPTQPPPPPASNDGDAVAEPNLVQVLVGLGSGLLEVLHKALHHLKSLVILQVHHVGSVFLPKGLELKLAFLALVQGPFPSLVELGGTGGTILNVECFNFQVQSINQLLVVDVVWRWRGTIVLVPVQGRDMKHSGHSKIT